MAGGEKERTGKGQGSLGLGGPFKNLGLSPEAMVLTGSRHPKPPPTPWLVNTQFARPHH